MPTITLPDGAQRHFDDSPSVLEIAHAIGPKLARQAVAGSVNDRLVDLCDRVAHDAEVCIITPQSEQGLEVIRHSCAHLVGHAVKQLFPKACMAIGPVVENGFYYDIYNEQPFSEEELEQVETRMRELIAKNYDVIKRMTPRDQAERLFKERHEPYKIQLIQELADDIEEVGLYFHEEYVDMCRGPHVPNTRFLKAFKITRQAGAYWRGDPQREMLQRVYGTAWADNKQLRVHLHQLEEAKKRDHRKLGKQLGLFHFQEEAPGMVFWHAPGWTLFRLLTEHMRRLNERAGYIEVHTPQMIDRSLWERSGHWDKFSEMIFVVSSEKRDYAIKPMNCPGHVQIYKQQLRSYRELPYRTAEFGLVHRNESSGTLHGLMRARCFTQDDAHIFCTEDQLLDELGAVIDMTFEVYRLFGFDDVSIALSTRPEQRVGSEQLWDRAERALARALEERAVDYRLQPGEGAFYGPKIEFILRDSIGRLWQCGTVQLDFSMPERLGASYVDAEQKRCPPVMIHRAILGSFERFIGILIEHHAGVLPLTLSPVQAAILTITSGQDHYARQVEQELKTGGARVSADLRNEKIGLKIREHTLQKIPYLLILGDRERETQTITVRQCDGTDLGTMSIDEFLRRQPLELAL